MVTTIQRWGNSQGVRLPKIILESMSLRENDQVEIAVFNDSIIIKKTSRKRRAKKSLEERFRNYNGNYELKEAGWGKPAGKEFW